MKKFTVNIMEYERGWGSKLDEVKEFDTLEQAVDFVKKYNSKNTANKVPDWYMVAQPANFDIPDDMKIMR